MSNYVLVSSVRNEEKYITETINSVVNQSVLPAQWIIVSDCSTDNTDNIITSYAERYKWIIYKRNNRFVPGMMVSERKVLNINLALSLMSEALYYDYIGFIDGDIQFSSTVFVDLMKHSDSIPLLGLTSGFIYNYNNGVTSPYFASSHRVGGPLQFFRKECYRQIGGYLPYAYEDSIAIVTAKMCGWNVQSFEDIVIHHLKFAGIPGRSIYKAHFHVGKMEYLTGDHWLYQLVRSLIYMREPPLFLSFLLKLSGYWFMLVTQKKIKTPVLIVEYLRCMQLKRIGLGFLTTKKMLRIETLAKKGFIRQYNSTFG